MAKGTLRVQDLRMCWHWAGLLKGGQIMPGAGVRGAVPDQCQPPQPQWIALDKPDSAGGLSFLTCTVREVANTPVSEVLVGAQEGHIHGSD